MKKMQQLGSAIARKQQATISGGIIIPIENPPPCGKCGVCIKTADDSIFYYTCTGRCQSGFRFWCNFP